ncbi:MAG: LysR family transcriptional regulator [Alphaproteobacteria bacterium]|nr:LysR family transcriptional regulator [Alphaproteobacteria bacterium]
MKDSLIAGLTATERIVVDKPRTIDFMGEELRVYSTPSLVRDIEMTCRNLLLRHVDANEDSVGTFVNVEHLAATPLGLWVEVAAKLIARDGRRVTFEVTVRDQIDDPIARGTHGRFVVDKSKTRERLAAKTAKA